MTEVEIWMQKIAYNTKDKELRRNRFIRLWSMLIVTLLIISMQIVMQKDNPVIAASGVRIYNYTSKKEYTYTSTQVRVTYDGKKISLDSTPGLIENGIALVSYKDIFARSAIKADCVYDKAAGTVTISKFGTTIVMKIGSKTAYINGKAVTAPLAPVKIKYVKAKVTKILVPTRFVFENLGYDYTWNKNTSTVSVSGKQDPLLLTFNNGDKFNYNGTLGKVTIDGQNISLGKMPSVITNNTAMLRAKKVFADSEIKADYKYNSKDQSISLSRNGSQLEMKIGSPIAKLNGRSILLDTAPMIVTNHNVGTSYVMVPGSFTASCLGFDYRWDNNTMTSIFTSRKDELIEEVKPQPEQKPDQQDKEPDQPKDNAPELGDSAVKWDRGKVLQLWDKNSSIYGVSSGILNIDNSSVDSPGNIYSIARDYSNVKLNSETYTIISTNPFSIVTSDVIGKQIRLNISNMNTIDNTYYLGAYNGGITDTAKAYSGGSNSTIVEFNLLSEGFSYDLSLSPDSRILSVNIYQNFLEKVTIGSNDDMDYITLTGNKPLNVVINQMIPGLITIELPRTKKLIDDRYVNLYDAKSIMYANLFYTADSTQIYIGLNDNNEYFIIEEGNNYTIMLPTKDKPFIPVLPNIPELPTQPETPVVPGSPIGDLSNYELIIPNPAGLTVSQIKHEDMYSKLRFAIRIPGDYTSYLNINPLIINSNIIKDVSIFLNSKYETEILVTTSKLQGYDIITDADYIYVNVGNPRDIYKNIVVLDPGHGGPSPGAIYNNTREKNINFKILYEIGKDLFNTDPSKLKVYYTRESDVDLSLAERAAFANKLGADLFVSLHMNANTNTSVYGTEIYYSNDNNKRNSAGLNSETFAKLFVNNLSSSLKTNNRGTRAAKYTVVHKNTVPAILVELGFMSNKNDFAKITNSTFQNEAAKAIYETLLMIFEMYPTGR